MRNMIKSELWKTTHNYKFYLALGVGCLIAMMDVVQNASLLFDFVARVDEFVSFGYSSSPYGYSLFVWWMGLNQFTYGCNLFFKVWPILAALPFAWSYAQERKNGVYYQLVCRAGKQTYFVAKTLAVFVSGGLAVSVPVLFNLLVNAMILPDMMPNVIMQNLNTPMSFLIELYYSNPWLYTLLWCGIDFLWGGTAACLCFAVGSKLRLQVLTVLVSYVVFYLLDWTSKILSSNLYWIPCEISPMELAKAITWSNNPGWIIFLEMVVLLAIGLIFGYRHAVKRELA